MLVKKANGKWRLCIDFTDINKACPKDSFPLPRIDLIVDTTAGHELLSFKDVFRLQSDQHGSQGPGENFIHHSIRNLLLPGNAVWTQECRSDLPEISEPDVPKADRYNNGGIHRRHARKVHQIRSPYRSSL